MPDILQEKKRKARKNHICSYCGEVIKKGYVYDYTKFIYDGDLYEWKNHIDCGIIASSIWNYVDPDEGMTEEDFQYGCADFCNTFICKDCNKYNKESDECDIDNRYCLDKITEVLKNNTFKRVKKDGDWMEKWILEPKTN